MIIAVGNDENSDSSILKMKCLTEDLQTFQSNAFYIRMNFRYFDRLYFIFIRMTLYCKNFIKQFFLCM